jgi:transposase
MAPKQPYDNGLRVQALTMLQDSKRIDEIIKTTGYSSSTIYTIRRKAIQRGYNPQIDPKIYLRYVEDAPRSGRPLKATPEVEQQVIQAISTNSTTRELSTQGIANIISPSIEGGISACTIHRIRRRRKYKPCKPTRKLGLTEANKAIRRK